MMIINPFSADCLDSLLKVSTRGAELRAVTHEGVQKEFKETFTWGSIGLYARTMAAFANARGGYIIFGVKDKPRVVTGLTNAGKTAFDELDRAKLTSGLNDLFSPEIDWDSSLFEPEGRALGLLYVHESDDKPVIARKAFQNQNANIREGDILYRYNSRTERAKFPELKRIVDDAKSREQRAMMRHIEELVKAGASNAAILDFGSSTLQGPTGEKVLISQEIIEKVSFIKEGEFKEVEGAPALRVIGDVVPTNLISLGAERIVHQAITTEDVITDFLDQSHGPDPSQYIRQAASGSTSFTPIHFYRFAAGMSVAQLIDFVNDVSTRSPAKTKLLSRLHFKEDMKLVPPSSSRQHQSTIFRKEYYEALTLGQLPALPIVEVDRAKAFLDAIRALDDSLIVSLREQLLHAVRKSFELHYEAAGSIADSIRRAACRIDYALYGASESEPSEHGSGQHVSWEKRRD